MERDRERETEGELVCLRRMSKLNQRVRESGREGLSELLVEVFILGKHHQV